MPLKRAQHRRSVRRDWFLPLVVSFAVLLGVVQVGIQWVFHPPILVSGVLAVVAFAAWCGSILLVLRLGRPLTEMRYRWLTRDVDRAMRKADRKRRRPAA